MGHYKRRDSARSGFVAASLLLATSVFVSARTSTADAVFDFEFDSFAVSGSVTFDDNFDDGFRDLPPTDALVDLADGTVTREEGGALVLSDSDGSAEAITPNTVLRMDTVVLQSLPITNSGTGTTTVTGALSPSGVVLPTPAQTSQFAGVELGSTSNSDVASIGVFLDGDSVVIVRMEVVAGMPKILRSDALTRGDLSVSENILLQISLDQSLDSAAFRYSVDGGANFVEEASWNSAPMSSSFDFDQDLFAQLSASAQTVPEPDDGLLGVAGLAAMGVLRRFPNGSTRASNPV
jgi:hypothetical protein